MEGLAFFAMALIGTHLLCFPVRRLLLELAVVDLPNARSSHDRPTARGGGLAIITVILVGTIALNIHTRAGVPPGLLLALLVISVVFFWDDMKSLPVSVRLVVQLTIALTAMSVLKWPSIRVELSPTLRVQLPSSSSAVAGMLWIAGYMNAFNFKDGINGLAGGQAVITAGGSALLAGTATGRWSASSVLVAFVVAGASAGFLPHNFPRARMFMGDVGSVPLGFLLAVLSIWIAQECSADLLIPLLLVHANFALDASFTWVRRVSRGERWFEPHRDHFYEQLVRSGKSHVFVTGLEMALQLIVLLLLIFYIKAGLIIRILLILATLAVWLFYFNYCHRSLCKAIDLHSAKKRINAATAELTDH